MKRIIVYRYFHEFENNRNHLKFIKYLNPDVKIFGLYGGEDHLFPVADEILGDLLEYNYLIKDKSTEWKWKNGDMTYQLWFNEIGYKIDFDIMHSIEWDLLYFEPLDVLFAHVPENTLALTGLIQIKKIEKKWYWTTNEKHRKEWLDLIQHYRDQNNEPFGMLGPGTSLPRIFLEKIKDIKIPEISLDEIRIPLLAQFLGVNMADTGFYRKWFSSEEWKIFNSNSHKIYLKTIENQLKKKSGRRVFHPFRDNISFEELLALYKMIPGKNQVKPSLSPFTWHIPIPRITRFF